MRRILRFSVLAAVAVIFCLSSVEAQYVRTSYFMDGATFRTQMNPALRTTRGYFNIPVAGQIGLEYMSNSLSIDKLLYKNPNGTGLVTFMDGSIKSKDVLSQLKNDNYLNIDVATTILGFGAYSGRTFWTFDVGVRVNTELSLPKELFQFLKEGNGSQGKVFDLKNLAVDVNSYTQTALGFSFPIGDNVFLGTKFKFLTGIANARVSFDKFNVSLMPDRWMVEADGKFDFSANSVDYELLTDDISSSEAYYDLGSLNIDPKGFAGMGGAIDLGLSVNLLNDHLTLSASVLDLGMIKWKGANSIAGKSHDMYEFTGFGLDGDTGVSESDFSKFARFIPVASADRTTRLTSVMNIGAEVSLMDRFISIGALSSTRFRAVSKDTEFTISGNIRPTNWLTATLSYSTMNSHFETVGAAINIHPSWINIFVGSDYVIGKMSKQFIPISQKAGNIYFGFAIPLGKMKTRLEE